MNLLEYVYLICVLVLICKHAVKANSGNKIK